MHQPKSPKDEALVIDDFVIDQARKIIARRIDRAECIRRSKDAEVLAVLELDSLDQEVFAVLFLDTRHRKIAFEKLFFGTIDRSCVHPRVVALRALECHAAAVILMHNHPSGVVAPSESDIEITQHLVDALKLFDIRVLDHIVVGGSETYSFAQHGRI